ncbi:MAG TPA: riboflavin synthase [Bacillota bacterium]
MFTGIIQEIGQVVRLDRQGQGARLLLRAGEITKSARVGDSISTNGVCLTVTQVQGDVFSADLSPETLRYTYFSRLKTGDFVNLEPALRLGDRVGGHLVTGHIDGLARLVSIRREGAYATFYFTTHSKWRGLIVHKGSVAVDGISLTVADYQLDRFSVAVIPQTLQETILQYKKPGDPVHLELDVIGKYVQGLLSNGGFVMPMENGDLSCELLSRYGY